MPPRRETHMLDKERRIQLALESISNGTAKSITQAAEMFSVAKQTLHDRFRGRKTLKQARAGQQLLSSLEEEELHAWINELARCHLNPRVNQLGYMAEVILRARGNPLPFGKPAVGATWHKRFLARHEDLRTILSRGLDHARAVALNRGNLDHWFGTFREICGQYGIQPRYIFNMDETGIMMGMGGRSRIVVSKNLPQNYLRQDGDRGWITTIETISGANKALPPFIIFATRSQQSRHQLRWYPRNLPRDWAFGISENGWTDNELGLEWLKSHFEPLTRPENGEYRLLILDGHSSHTNPEFICFAREKRIILLCFPPHSTHILQPLDVSIFQPLKHYYQREIEYDYRDGFCTVDRQRFIQIYDKIRPQVFTPDNIRSAWEKTGLLSLNPGSVYEQLNFRPSTPPSQQQPDSEALQSSPLTNITSTPHRPETLEDFDRHEQRFQEFSQFFGIDPSLAKERHQLILEGAKAAVVRGNNWKQRYIDLWQSHQSRPRERTGRKAIPMVARVLTAADIEQFELEEGMTSNEEFQDSYMESALDENMGDGENWGLQPFNPAKTAEAVQSPGYRATRYFHTAKRKNNKS